MPSKFWALPNRVIKIILENSQKHTFFMKYCLGSVHQLCNAHRGCLIVTNKSQKIKIKFMWIKVQNLRYVISEQPLIIICRNLLCPPKCLNAPLGITAGYGTDWICRILCSIMDSSSSNMYDLEAVIVVMGDFFIWRALLSLYLFR